MEVSDSQPRSQYLTVQEVAKMLKISGQSVGRLFGNMEGVLDVSEHKLKQKHYRYGTLRIPTAALARFLFERRIK